MVLSEYGRWQTRLKNNIFGVCWGDGSSMVFNRDIHLDEALNEKASLTVTYFNSDSFSRVIVYRALRVDDIQFSGWQLYLCNRVISPFHWSSTCINDMKRTYEEENKNFKSKKPYDRRSIHEPGPSTSKSTSTGTTYMPYIPACESDATSSAEVIAGGSVSLTFNLCIFNYWLIFEQTAHNFGVSTSVSSLEISDPPPVSVPAAGVNLFT